MNVERLRAALCFRVRLTACGVAVLYCLFSSVFVLLLAVLLPPIQGPDEGAHFVRADQISRGTLISRRLNAGASGGIIDLGVMEAIKRFYPVVVDPDARVRATMYAPVEWGSPGQWSFPNTAVYPPVFYLPAAGAIILGKHLGFDVLKTEIWARVAQGMTSILIGSLAISLAGPAALWFFMVLLLPSSAALMGSLTQDGPMLACSALAAACLLQLRLPGGGARVSRIYLPAASIIIALIAMSRPPYAAIGLLILTPSEVPGRTRWKFCAGAWLAAMIWWLVCALHIFVSVDQSNAADAASQMRLLLAHPGRIPALVRATLEVGFIKDYAGYFITTFAPPGWFNRVAWLLLACAATATILCGIVADRMSVALTAVSLAAATIGIFLIQYLTWTPVGGAAILGVLGRYFLPLAAVLPLAMVKNPIWRRQLPACVVAPLFGFPTLAIVTTLDHLVVRYYL